MQIMYPCNMLVGGKAALMTSRDLVTFVEIVKLVDIVNLVR